MRLSISCALMVATLLPGGGISAFACDRESRPWPNSSAVPKVPIEDGPPRPDLPSRVPAFCIGELAGSRGP
jgi:hypothetical protein